MTNNIKQHEVVWLQLSAGQGPKECAWVVTQVLKSLLYDTDKPLLNSDFTR